MKTLKYIKISRFLWMANPIGAVFSVIGLLVYIKERASEEQKILIGKKWLWFIGNALITSLAWMFSVILMVGLTGGV